jgi:hypothetical protein
MNEVFELNKLKENNKRLRNITEESDQFVDKLYNTLFQTEVKREMADLKKYYHIQASFNTTNILSYIKTGNKEQRVALYNCLENIGKLTEEKRALENEIRDIKNKLGI